jgi:hypothetical protein
MLYHARHQPVGFLLIGRVKKSMFRSWQTVGEVAFTIIIIHFLKDGHFWAQRQNFVQRIEEEQR